MPVSESVDDEYMQYDTYWRMQQVLSIDILQYLLQTCKVWLEEEEFTPETLRMLLAFNILNIVNGLPVITCDPSVVP